MQREHETCVCAAKQHNSLNQLNNTTICSAVVQYDKCRKAKKSNNANVTSLNPCPLQHQLRHLQQCHCTVHNRTVAAIKHTKNKAVDSQPSNSQRQTEITCAIILFRQRYLSNEHCFFSLHFGMAHFSQSIFKDAITFIFCFEEMY